MAENVSLHSRITSVASLLFVKTSEIQQSLSDPNGILFFNQHFAFGFSAEGL